MFSILHALAKQATLMITIAAEGDDELRVNVTPVPADTKTKAKLPQPLSLRATPAEFDADFIAALATWQAPKRSLLQQAQDAVSPPAAAASGLALPAPKAEAKVDGKNDKPARKGRGGKGGDDDKKIDAVPGAAAAAGEAAAAADEVIATSASADAGDQLPADAGDASGGTDAAQDHSAQQPASASEVVDAGAQDSVAPAAAADVVKEAAPEIPAGDEPVDKFTLDLF